jgi:hypothetical protein
MCQNYTPRHLLTNICKEAPFCHSESPQATKNLALTGKEETLRLGLRVTDWVVYAQLFMALCIVAKTGKLCVRRVHGQCIRTPYRGRVSRVCGKAGHCGGSWGAGCPGEWGPLRPALARAVTFAPEFAAWVFFMRLLSKRVPKCGRQAPNPCYRLSIPAVAAISLEKLADTTKLQWRIERDYQELKQETALGHFEGRGGRGFHHHATLCIAACGFPVAGLSSFPPPALTSGQPLRYLKYPKVGSRGDPTLRPERHSPYFIATIKRKLMIIFCLTTWLGAPAAIGLTANEVNL